MKLIILDRDGVINKDRSDGVRSPAQWEPLPGSLEAIARLTKAGYQLAVATNQSGIARGQLDLDTLYAIHRKMHEMVVEAGGHIDLIVFCPHSDANECQCRKPMPGMLYTINERLNVDLTDVHMVGDSLRDLQAAMAVGAMPVLVRTGKGMQTVESNKGLDHIPAFDDLAAFVDHLLDESTDEPEPERSKAGNKSVNKSASKGGKKGANKDSKKAARKTANKAGK